MNNTMDKRFNFFAVEYEDGVVYVKGFPSNVPAREFFRAISEYLSFSDCTGTKVLEIYWHGERVCYDGWHRGMLFRFTYKDEKVAWEGRFPEFDH